MLTAGTTACGSTKSLESAAGSVQNQEIQLLISAATSLKDALEEIQMDYERSHPHIKLHFNFGGSGALQQQIEQGAPVDLFLSAALNHMQELEDKGLVDQQRNLLTNELVVIVPKNTKYNLSQLTDLTSVSLHKIAIGIPESVPAGDYAKQTLIQLNLWETLQSNLVQAKDVRQVLHYVETGNADAGFVYKTDAQASDQVTTALNVDPSLHSPIVYPMGILNTSKHPEEVKELYEYLQSDEALHFFSKYGFTSAIES